MPASAVMETPALIEQRQAITERRIHFFELNRDIERHVRQVWSDEEGSKSLLKRLRVSMATLQDTVRLYSDVNDNTGEISKAIQSIQDVVVDLRTLDPRLDWSIGLVLNGCASFQRVLAEKFPPVKPVEREPASYHPKRLLLLDMADDLSAALLCLGDPAHGGLEQRKPALALAGDFRLAVCADLTANLSDHEKLGAMIRGVMQCVAELDSLPSQTTGQIGFMRGPMPAINRRCEAILSLLASAAPPTRPRNSLSIKP